VERWEEEAEQLLPRFLVERVGHHFAVTSDRAISTKVACSLVQSQAEIVTVK
jgi:hypothetical protein